MLIQADCSCTLDAPSRTGSPQVEPGIAPFAGPGMAWGQDNEAAPSPGLMSRRGTRPCTGGRFGGEVNTEYDAERDRITNVNGVSPGGLGVTLLWILRGSNLLLPVSMRRFN